HVRVLARDVLWSLDAAQPCRTPEGAAMKSSVLRESASRRNIGLTLGQTVTGSGVVSLLEAVRFERGGLPLVLASDNGSENVNEDVEAYLAKKRVVHLRSLPRTPQHNAWAERAIGELRQDSGLRADLRIEPGEAWQRLSDS